ncbi:hypothetical protein ACQU0X_25840 [Pseudovibrio ascidiaceicola]|uniref:hypothetical protein n=1 Tax=Pseudovibrio ascidiaceicola TaxID=285279 RepID=UPI0006D03A48
MESITGHQIDSKYNSTYMIPFNNGTLGVSIERYIEREPFVDWLEYSALNNEPWLNYYIRAEILDLFPILYEDPMARRMVGHLVRLRQTVLGNRKTGQRHTVSGAQDTHVFMTCHLYAPAPSSDPIQLRI